MIRTATADEAPTLAALVNAAFQVEAFFKIGDRTSAGEVARLMAEGEFLVSADPEGTIDGCVYLTCAGGRGYFGMLSIDPSKQRAGVGRRLIDAAEARARARGCRVMDIHIVNLREDLPEYYRRLGYDLRGTLPFPEPQRLSRPCHFVVMSKVLD